MLKSAPYKKSGVTLGIDPGVTTGVVLCKGEDLTSGWEVKDLSGVASAIRSWHPDAVVMEDFLGSKRWVEYKRPIEVIGVVKLVCEEEGIPLVLQSPAILQSRRLQEMAKVSPSPHVRSAYIHVLHFLHA